MEKELQHLIDELGEAINTSLSHSDRFAEIMNEMEQAGYDVFVVLEASIGVRKNGEILTAVPAESKPDLFDGDLSMNETDLEFLRALNISA